MYMPNGYHMPNWLWWRGRGNRENGPETPPSDIIPPLEPARSFLDKGRYIIEPESLKAGRDEKALGIACVGGGMANADYLLVNQGLLLRGQPHNMWGVFDGVTVSFDPESASRIAAEELNEPPQGADAAGLLRSGFEKANGILATYRDERPHRQDVNAMSTASVAVYNPLSRELTVGHVGDSRIYLVGENAVKLLTEDHRRLRRAPELSADFGFEAWRPFISKFIGHEEGAAPQIDTIKLPDGRKFLCLVTDGIYGPLSKPAGYDAMKAWAAMSAEAEATDPLVHAELIRKHDEAPGKFEKTLLGVLSIHDWNLQRAAETLVKLAEAGPNARQDDKTVIMARL